MTLLILSALFLIVYSAAARALCRSFAYRGTAAPKQGILAPMAGGLYRHPLEQLAAFRLVQLVCIILCLWAWLRGLALLQFVGLPLLDATIAGLLACVLTALPVGIGLLTESRLGADRCLVGLCLVLRLFNIVLLPIATLLLLPARRALGANQAGLSHLLRLLGYHDEAPARPYSADSERDEQMGETDRQILHNSLHLSDIRLRDCLVPRIEIVAVPNTCPRSRLLETFTRSGKTKIPVYQDTIDHILGYVHASEMFRTREGQSWTDAIQQMPIVPESMNAQRCMQLLMQQKKSLALVVDEFGGTAGIVSLEDLVEEIFGEIEDEHDVSTLTARQTAPGEYIFSARCEIERLNEMFNLTLPESDDYQTLGGLILWQLQDFPKTGQTLSLPPYRLTILKTQTAKIELVKLRVVGENL